MKSALRLALLATLILPATALRAQDATDPDAIVQVEADDRDALMGMEGQIVTVTGTLTGVGATPTGSLTFLNFAKVPNSFVAIVSERNLAMFPDGFDDLKGKRIALTGTVKIYRDETPQIELETAGQIEVVEAVKPE